MEIRGKLNGDAAKRFPGYHYRVPIYPEPDVRMFDPARLCWMHEYPRYVIPPGPLGHGWHDLADYCIRLSDGVLQVILLPNQYTWAQSQKVVFEASVSPDVAAMDDRRFVAMADEALLRAVR